MADLIPMAAGWDTYYLYAKPNPALTEILLNARVRSQVEEWGLKVEMTYLANLASRKSHRDHGNQPHLENAIEASVFIGGYENDRWVGELTVHSPYAMADEYGRENPTEEQHDSVYEGRHALRDSLYANLPQI